MDAQISAWVRGVEAACRRARVEYVLHGPEVLREYGGDGVFQAFERLMGEVPEMTWRTMVSDWARWQFLGRHGAGTLYLDTDNRLTRGLFPDFSRLAPGLWCHGEGFEPRLPAAGCMYARGEAGASIGKLAAQLSTGKVLGILELDKAGRAALYADILRRGRLVYWLGPGWMRRVVEPQARDRGLQVAVLPQDVASSRNEGAWIYHAGRGDWLHKVEP